MRPVLKQGMRGNDVRTLQRSLLIKPDGIYGPKTAAAVRDFQRRQGLEADGIAGEQTLGKIFGRRTRRPTSGTRKSLTEVQPRPAQPVQEGLPRWYYKRTWQQRPRGGTIGDREGRQLMHTLIGQARTFTFQGPSSLDTVAKGIDIASNVSTGVEMLTGASLPLSTPVFAFLGTGVGLAQIGKASAEGKALARTRSCVAMYHSGFLEEIAGHAELIDEASPYQSRLSTNRFYLAGRGDARRALKALGEEQGRELLRYLKNQYGHRGAIETGLRPALQEHTLRWASPRLRRYLTGRGTPP
jgi:hypothetical protein